jgi:hypothetical protein
MEMWTSYDFMMQKEGRFSPAVGSVLAVTALAALLPIGSEFAHQKKRRVLQFVCFLALPLALSVVFMAAIQRNGSAVDNDDAARRQIAEQVRIARAEETEAVAQLAIDKAEVAKNCSPWGPKCQRAKDDQAATEGKLAAARAGLQRHGVVVDDPWTAGSWPTCTS